MKKAVVTGATSFIGESLVRNLVDIGVYVIAIIRPNSKKVSKLQEIDGSKLEIIECPLESYSSYLPEINNCDVFFHLAWAGTNIDDRDNVQTQLINIQFTLDAVCMAQKFGCKKFIGAGSQAEYGVVCGDISEQTPVFPESGYGIAKYSAGKLSHLLCSQLNIEFNWVRIVSIYGENDSKNTLIMFCLESLLKNRRPALTRCEQVWDYLYIEDASQGLIKVAQAGKNGKTYVLGSGKKAKLNNFVETIYKLSGANCGIGYGKKAYLPHQPMYLVADISTLSSDTGWFPKISFEEGIKNIITNIKAKAT